MLKYMLHNAQKTPGPSEVVYPLSEGGPYEKLGVVGHSSMRRK